MVTETSTSKTEIFNWSRFSSNEEVGNTGIKGVPVGFNLVYFIFISLLSQWIESGGIIVTWFSLIVSRHAHILETTCAAAILSLVTVQGNKSKFNHSSDQQVGTKHSTLLNKNYVSISFRSVVGCDWSKPVQNLPSAHDFIRE